MLSYTFNDKTIFVSDAEGEKTRMKLAAGATKLTLSDREVYVAIEYGRKYAISSLTNKLKQGAERVRLASRNALNAQAKTTAPEDFMQMHADIDATYDAEIARIKSAGE
jgi:hypothetical protein